MMRKFILLIFLMTCNSIIAQVSLNLGKDTSYCLNFPSEINYLGANLKIQNGQSPYDYTWECTVKVGTTGNYTASDFLNDTTIAEPYFIETYPYNSWISFILTVKDHDNNFAKDTINVRFSNFGYTQGYNTIYLNRGDSILFSNVVVGGGIPPLKYKWQPQSGLTYPDSLKTWCKPDNSIEYYQIAIDSNGCISNENLAYKLILPALGSFSLSPGNAIELINPVQIGSIVKFNNPQMKKALISIYQLNGEKILSLKSWDNYVDLDQLISIKGLYIIKVVIGTSNGIGKFIVLNSKK